jgi:hypothetical protein
MYRVCKLVVLTVGFNRLQLFITLRVLFLPFFYAVKTDKNKKSPRELAEAI